MIDGREWSDGKFLLFQLIFLLIFFRRSIFAVAGWRTHHSNGSCFLLSAIALDFSWSSEKNSVESSGAFAGALLGIVDDWYAAGVMFELGSTLFLF